MDAGTPYIYTMGFHQFYSLINSYQGWNCEGCSYGNGVDDLVASRTPLISHGCSYKILARPVVEGWAPDKVNYNVLDILKSRGPLLSPAP